ncbi:CST complex subunit ctc1 [Dinochytrium kinnereticum]|nr:CST complex subunit ctc1 [Dinochytrium kinnereticum]
MGSFRVVRIVELLKATPTYDACVIPILIGEISYSKDGVCWWTFRDATGQLPAELAYPFPSPDGSLVCLLKWTVCECMRSDSEDLIRILEVSRFWIIPKVHYLRSIRVYEFDEEDYDLLKDVPAPEDVIDVALDPDLILQHTDDSLGSMGFTDAFKKQRSVTLYGEVNRKSGLIKAPHKSLGCFVVTLKLLTSLDTTSDLNLNVVFEGSLDDPFLLVLFHQIQVGAVYLFTDMKPQQLKEKETIRFLKYVPGSNLHRLQTNAAFPALLNDFIARNAQSSVHSQGWNRGPMISYSGEITNVNDNVLGYYLLDGKFDLYLTFNPHVYKGQGLRVGTKVELMNLHVFSSNAVTFGSFLGQKKQIALVACLMSTVRIISYPEEPNSGVLVDPSVRNTALHKLKGMGIPDIFLLSAFTNCLRNLDSCKSEGGAWKESIFDMAKEALYTVGFTTLPHNSSKLNSALAHDDCCEISSLRYEPPVIISISDIEVSEFLPRPFSSGGPNVVNEYRSIRISHKDLGWKNPMLFAYVDCDDDGNVWIEDSSGRLPAQCSRRLLWDNRQRRPILISSFSLVVESFSREKITEDSPWKLYIQLDDSETHNLIKSTSNLKMDTQFNKGADVIKDIIAIIHHVTPAYLRLNSGQTNCIKSAYLHASIWGGLDISSIKNSFESPTQALGEILGPALHFLPLFEIKGAYIISGVQYANTLESLKGRGPIFFTLTEKTRVEKLIDYNGDLRVNLPYAMEQNLRYCLTKVEKCLSVNEAIGIGSALAESEELIILDGLVVSKELRAAESLHAFPGLNPTTLFKERNVGYGRLDKLLVVRICDEKALDPDNFLDVYLDQRMCTFHFGLVPGAVARFRRLCVRRSSKGSVYCYSLPETSVEILEQHRIISFQQREALSRSWAMKKRTLLKDVFLPRFGLEKTAQNVLIRAHVSHVIEILLESFCSICSQITNSDRCSLCSKVQTNAQIQMRGFAKMYIHDGTLEAQIHLENLESIMEILAEDSQTRSLIEAYVLQNHAIRYENDPFHQTETSDHSLDTSYKDGSVGEASFIEELLTKNTENRLFLFECRNTSQNLVPHHENQAESFYRGKGIWDLSNAVALDEIRVRLIRISETSVFPTSCLPRLQLQAMRAERLNPRQEAHNILNPSSALPPQVLV